MMRLAKRGNTIVPVKVFEKTPKQRREEGGAYWAFSEHSPSWPPRLELLPIFVGHGDTIEEAVDAVSEQLPVS
jgi:hypothetical protein